jgi:hypothetical protein
MPGSGHEEFPNGMSARRVVPIMDRRASAADW